MSGIPEFDGFFEDEVIAELYLHIIFWTRKLQPVLTSTMLAAAREPLDQAMFKIEGEVLACGGAADHLHIIARISPNHAAQKASDVLRQSSQALVANESGIRNFKWHDVELSVTLDPESLEAFKESMTVQEAHHKTVPFQVELTRILDEHEMDYDEQELWS